MDAQSSHTHINSRSNIRKSNIPLNARILRRGARRVIYNFGHGSLNNSPVFFANSFPKSGTHLLTQVLKGFTKIGPAVDSGLLAVVTFDGFTGRQRSRDEIMMDLKRLLPGDIAYGHVHAFPEAVSYLCKEGVAAYFILRDPRDVVVSHVHYVAEMAPNHIHHRYYHETLKTFDERLCASIQGVSAEQLSAALGFSVIEPLPDIRTRFEPYLDWLVHPEVKVLRYEDLISHRREIIGDLLDHAIQRGFIIDKIRDSTISILENSINPRQSPTFRSGKIGDWPNWFNARHKQLFKQISSELIIQLGYEFNPDW